MKTLKLLPLPERFTELYFTNSLLLPKEAVTGEPITFSFTIHNLEGATISYPYSVYFVDAAGNKTVFKSSTIVVADGETVSSTISYAFLPSNLKGTVIVDLTQLNQKIDFLLSNNQ